MIVRGERILVGLESVPFNASYNLQVFPSLNHLKPCFLCSITDITQLLIQGLSSFWSKELDSCPVDSDLLKGG